MSNGDRPPLQEQIDNLRQTLLVQNGILQDIKNRIGIRILDPPPAIVERSSPEIMAFQSAGETILLQGRKVRAFVTSELLENEVENVKVQIRQYTMLVAARDYPLNATVIEYRKKQLKIVSHDTNDDNGVTTLVAVER